MHAVTPKEDCPHLVSNFASDTIPQSIRFPTRCTQCRDASENWLCLQCWFIGCSRFVNSHQAEHFAETKHSVSASFSDLSVWCYECESYIKHATLQGLLKVLYASKFGEQEEKDDLLSAFANEDESSADDEDWDPSKSNEGSESKPVDNDDSSEDEDEPEMSLDLLRQMMGIDITKDEKPVNTILGNELTIEKIANVIKEGKAKKIIVMSGAGISVAAGIPDFRTPGTGLYDNLQKYGLPYPTAVFELDYFRNKPEPFYTLAKELYPGNFKPTAVHYFIKILHQKGLLLRNFTQNIDTLERVAGIPGDVLVEAHGSFAKAHCINCKAEEDVAVVKNSVFASEVPKCKSCGGLVKPDIIFFGESLPPRFFQQTEQDFPECDLLLVIGTSLQVQPFASLTGKVKVDVPRLLINREEVGTLDPRLAMLGLGGSTHFRFGLQNNYRDVAWLGDCQDGVLYLAELLGWKDELDKLVKEAAITTKF